MQIGVDVAVASMPKGDETLAVAGGNFFKFAHGLENGTTRHGHVAADAVWAEHIGGSRNPAPVGPQLVFLLLANALHTPQGVIKLVGKAGILKRHSLLAAVHLK